MLVRLSSVNDFAEWRATARGLLLAGVAPDEIAWADPEEPVDLLAPLDPGVPARITDRPAGRVPKHFVRLAEVAICHSDKARFALLYRLLWRMQKQREVLFDLNDTDVGKLRRRVEAVLAESQRMKDELRFRRAVAGNGEKGLAAWFAPRHYVLERVAVHFAGKIAHEAWLITTPYRSAYWDRRTLSFGGGSRSGRRVAG